MIILTEPAQAAVLRFMSQSQKSVNGLRITVADGGCSGLKYGLSLEEAALDDDMIVETGAVKVFVAPEAIPLIVGVTVDFVENLEGAGFTFNNPNASAQCSCGKSFSN
ncbi:MAG: hypothetical protein A2516_03990 [Alphaproteobacteria bacterium RIFOXYD12_FULL_60_8]|nr:MAG: hypothetical protein A2516_03990 [Alphaproteobacteria bacterium RIFOXYD12_FULL_60_8]